MKELTNYTVRRQNFEEDNKSLRYYSGWTWHNGQN